MRSIALLLALALAPSSPSPPKPPSRPIPPIAIGRPPGSPIPRRPCANPWFCISAARSNCRRFRPATLSASSADNRFILYVNGARVGDGPARGDLTHWRYERFDLAPYL